MTKKTTWIVGAGLLVASVLALAWYLDRSDFGDSGAPEASPSLPSRNNVAHPRPAPAFDLPQSDGKPFHLAAWKGSAVVVHFWASWCPPCLGELPRWLEFASQWKGKPVRFVAVSLDQRWTEALRILPADQVPPGVVSVLDAEQKLPELFGTYQYPETYLLDPQLNIVSKWVGAQDWSGPVIRQTIESVLH